MGVYSGPELLKIIKRSKAHGDGEPITLPFILVEPFDEKFVGPNSIDVHLDDTLRVYKLDAVAERHPELFQAPLNPMEAMRNQVNECLFASAENPTVDLVIPKQGRMLWPDIVYLGRTKERTVTGGAVPWLDGRSSIGRLGMAIHVTAGRGDDGFGEKQDGGCTWTLEITVRHPLWVTPGLRVGQITYFTLEGPRKPYEGRYSKQVDPTASRLFLDPPPPPEPEAK